jgi:7-cyano-7-deazaguanine synthase
MTSQKYAQKAMVIFSGGQDSTTCLALAKERHQEVHAITFAYNQRHQVELKAAKAIAETMQLKSHAVVDLGPIFTSTSPLVSERAVDQYDSVDDLPGGLEATFVPGRNVLFLTLAASYAYARSITDIYIGVCEEDFGGYWDCRGSFIVAMQRALSEGLYGTESTYTLHTPLLHLSKSEAVKLALDTLGEDFEKILGLTHTCYQGTPGGCGKCHACHLRDRGFREAGIADPLWKLRTTEF